VQQQPQQTAEQQARRYIATTTPHHCSAAAHQRVLQTYCRANPTASKPSKSNPRRSNDNNRANNRSQHKALYITLSQRSAPQLQHIQTYSGFGAKGTPTARQPDRHAKQPHSSTADNTTGVPSTHYTMLEATQMIWLC
jgi:hypothetical protein